MQFLDSRHPPLRSLQPLEQNMLREAYEQAGSVARSMGVPRAANPYAKASVAQGKVADKQRLATLAEHWWFGWDKATSTGSRSSLPAARRRSTGS